MELMLRIVVTTRFHSAFRFRLRAPESGVDLPDGQVARSTITATVRLVQWDRRTGCDQTVGVASNRGQLLSGKLLRVAIPARLVSRFSRQVLRFDHGLGTMCTFTPHVQLRGVSVERLCTGRIHRGTTACCRGDVQPVRWQDGHLFSDGCALDRAELTRIDVDRDVAGSAPVSATARKSIDPSRRLV